MFLNLGSVILMISSYFLMISFIYIDKHYH